MTSRRSRSKQRRKQDVSPPLPPLEERLAQALDPTGETRASMAAFDAFRSVPAITQYLAMQGVNLDALIGVQAEMDSLHRGAAQAIRVFAPLGWAPCGAMPTSAYATALEALATEGPEAAEQVLVEAWDDEHRLKRPVQQISSLGHPEEDYHDLFWHRSRLLAKAYEHHRAGAYEASIPILLAQIEGFVADVSGGKMFFSRDPQKAVEVVDASAIATLDESLPVAREFFSAGMDYTASEGSLRRHGILHGRELGYATRINSVKAFVLLQALVEWAQPLVRAEVERRKASREALWVDSDEVDEQGRRRDQREFIATRSSLRFLHTSQMGSHNNTGRYDADRLSLVESRFVKDGLPADHGIEMRVRDDGQAWWAWRRTISGWYLGIGAVGPTPSQWFYDAADAPSSGPDGDPEGWGGHEHAVLPNWASR